MSDDTSHADVRTADDPTEAVLSTSGLSKKSLCDYVINVATGCRHGCTFCYVPATPNISARGDMLEDTVDVQDGQREWGDYVLYRDDLPKQLPGLLDRKQTWRVTDGRTDGQHRDGHGIIGISYSTDPYMDRRAAAITNEAVRILTQPETVDEDPLTGQPVDYDPRHVRVQTRNPLLAWGTGRAVFEAAGDYVTIGSSINTLHEERAAAIEPQAPTPRSRIIGLQRFNRAGVRTFVSMSPTYPTIDGVAGNVIYDLLIEIDSIDPDVVFHEPINPRGDNYELVVAAAREAGLDGWADRLEGIRVNKRAWKNYAIRHLRSAQFFGEALDLPIHLWPDRSLLGLVDDDTRDWLERWLARVSPEPFAGREPPETPLPRLP